MRRSCLKNWKTRMRRRARSTRKSRSTLSTETWPVESRRNLTSTNSAAMLSKARASNRFHSLLVPQKKCHWSARMRTKISRQNTVKKNFSAYPNTAVVPGWRSLPARRSFTCQWHRMPRKIAFRTIRKVMVWWNAWEDTKGSKQAWSRLVGSKSSCQTWLVCLVADPWSSKSRSPASSSGSSSTPIRASCSQGVGVRTPRGSPRGFSRAPPGPSRRHSSGRSFPWCACPW
mmetsp:Transcript_55595/g.153902  ORF Transcript_55595/g.153902 Transcript_55595/m.153902 type:complete len:230 (-) Transcript_55595:125-814(-)